MAIYEEMFVAFKEFTDALAHVRPAIRPPIAMQDPENEIVLQSHQKIWTQLEDAWCDYYVT